MTVYDTSLSWNSFLHHVTQIQNPLPRGKNWYSIFRSIKLGNGSKYDRSKPEKGQVHLCKHLRRATNLWMLKQKKSMPCSSKRHSVSSQSEKHSLFHIIVAKIYALWDISRSKTIPFGTAHISDHLSRWVISLFPLPRPPFPEPKTPKNA